MQPMRDLLEYCKLIGYDIKYQRRREGILFASYVFAVVGSADDIERLRRILNKHFGSAFCYD